MTVDFGEIGTLGVVQNSGILYEEWSRDLLGSNAMRTFREMIDNSGALGGWYTIFEFLLRQADIRVDAGADTPSAKAERDRIDESLRDMETPLETIVGEIASAGQFGFAIWEKVFKIRRGPDETDEALQSKYSDGRIGWCDWAFRPQDSLVRWEFDEKSRWTAVIQSSAPTYISVTIPREKLIHFVPRAWKRSPEGRSMIRSAVIAYKNSKGHAERWGIAGFKAAAGQLFLETPVETWDTSSTAEAVAARAMRTTAVEDIGKFSMTEYSAIAVPQEIDRNGQSTGWKLRQLEGAKYPFPYADAVKYWDSRQLLPVLCEHIILGLDKHGSFALGDSKTDLFALALGAILKRACVVLTEAACELSTMNGIPPEDHAIISHDDIETPELTQMANFVAQVLGVEPARLNDELRGYLETYARLPTGALAAPTPEALAAFPPAPAPKPFQSNGAGPNAPAGG